jgi:hypothetical protein
VLAAWRTIRATVESAALEVKASQAQTAVVQKQIETTVRLARDRDENEYVAFRIMLHAAMTQVIAEAAWAKTTYPKLFTPTADVVSIEASEVRRCITKGAFAELRSACVKMRSPLTHEFLYLEGEIDNFALQVGTYAFSGAAAMPVPKGKHARLGEQLDVIEDKAKKLREKAARDRFGLTLPGWTERDDIWAD